MVIRQRKKTAKPRLAARPGEEEGIIKILDFSTDRYSSLKLIPWWDQKKISRASVMVVGAGALGNEVLKNLALLGIGHIFIIDLDTIDVSNLTRSVLFRYSDSGQSKAKIAAQRVKDINPDVKVSYMQGDITTDIGLGVFRRMDLVIGCVDNVEARVFINKACWKTNKPWINGGIDEMQGIADVFIPPEGACYECTMTDIDYQEMNSRRPCGLPLDEIAQGKVPTTPTIASIISGIQVQETLKIIHGHSLDAGKGLAFYGITNEFHQIHYPRNPDCMAHLRLGNILSLKRKVGSTTFRELFDLLEKRDNGKVAVELDFDLLLHLYCACGLSVDKIKRRDRITRAELTCPKCGETMSMELASQVDREREKLLDMTFASIGVAPLEILSVSIGCSNYWVEFSADKAQILDYA